MTAASSAGYILGLSFSQTSKYAWHVRHGNTPYATEGTQSTMKTDMICCDRVRLFHQHHDDIPIGHLIRESTHH